MKDDRQSSRWLCDRCTRADGLSPCIYDHADHHAAPTRSKACRSLEEQRRGLYRELQEVCLGDSEFLETTFGSKGPFWGRSYTFYLDGAPLTVVYEVFSPGLDAFLGPSHPAAVRVTADAS